VKKKLLPLISNDRLVAKVRNESLDALQWSVVEKKLLPLISNDRLVAKVSKQCTLSVSKYLSLLTFFTNLIIHLIQKIVLLSFTLIATCFIIVGILNLIYHFTVSSISLPLRP
jgi:hypothetical protein